MSSKSLFRNLALGVVVLLSVASLPWEIPAQAAGTTCKTFDGPHKRYKVTVCFTQPANDATLTGDQTVSTSVSVTGSNPGVQRAVFYLDNQYLLTDYAAAYTFSLPTNHFVDGGHQLQVEMLMRDGFTTPRTNLSLHFHNGVTRPPVNPRTFTPSAGSLPAPGQPFVLAAAGDGASGENNEGLVTNLVAGWNPNLFLYLGDVYEKGMVVEFYNWYGTTTSTYYGRFRSITNPTIGNHEYENGIAPGYFDYWDNIPNYYSFNFAGWHFISLNSTSQFGQTAPGSAQYNWLAQDLNANTAPCTVAYWHHPVYNVGPQGDATTMDNIWALLVQHGVDIVLTGHDHNYQRWVPLNGQGTPAPNGLTQFVVGTGGHGIQNFIRSDSRLVIGFDTPPQAFGALRLQLYADRADFQFINTQSAVLDSGSIPCVGAPPTTTPVPPTATPTSPPSLTPSPTSTDIATDSPTPTPSPTSTDIATDSPTPTPFSLPTLTLVPTPTASPLPGQTFNFTPVADAYVNESSPDTKYGTATVLRVDASPIMNAYLRFDVEGLILPVTRATVRLYANSSSTLGYEVHGVANNSWDELGLTYTTAPAFGNGVGTSGSFGSGVWTAVDVTSLISGNGLVSLALTTSSGTTISLASRESGANAPQLVVQTE